jgi:flagellar hook protein FlgE
VLRSMFTGISGLRSHQTMIDVTGNNIANVNTSGFKSNAVVFQDVLSQTLRGAGQPSTAVGGTNPSQVGLGVRVAAITTNLSQGSIQRTNRPTDVALEGDGYFILDSSAGRSFTRNGAFSLDANGYLVSQEGAFVQGWQSNAAGVVNSAASATKLKIPVGELIAPQQTSNITFNGNLPNSAALGTVVSNSTLIYDQNGNDITLAVAYTKAAGNSWNVTATYTPTGGGAPVPVVGLAPAVLSFDATGSTITSPPPAGAPLRSRINIPAAAIPGLTTALNLDYGGNLPSGVADPLKATGFADTTSLNAITQDGSAEGTLNSFGIGQDGLVVGSYSNGRTKAIGQIALALFSNPEGLEKSGGNNFIETVNSGLPQIGAATIGGRGLMAAGALEMSNVDLAQEFTNLIVGQRGFQANSRVITTSDEILQELVNLKR